MWVLDVEGGRVFPVAVRGADYNPTWTPDREGRLTFTSNGDLFETLVGRQDPPVRLLRRENYQFPQSWSPDGRFLAFMEISPTGTDIWIMPREGNPMRLLDSSSNAGAARFSPKGGWLAYVSDETGQEEVYVRRYAGSDRGKQVSRGGGREPVWSAGGQELFYRSGNRMMAVEITTEPDFRSEAPIELWERPYFSQEIMAWNYDVAADGRFLMLGLAEESDTAPTQVNVVLNWFEELQERVAIP